MDRLLGTLAPCPRTYVRRQSASPRCSARSISPTTGATGRSDLHGASRAVLTHLAVTGPLTVGEAATHLGRAQSVVSEIVDGLERKGMLERERDPADRRRTLVWLTGAGQDALRRDGEVLAVDAIAAALARMPADARAGLIDGASALLAAATHPVSTHTRKDVP